MGAAVYVAVQRAVVFRKGVDDTFRFLCGGGVVEINEGLAVNGGVQNFELLPDGFCVEHFSMV